MMRNFIEIYQIHNGWLLTIEGMGWEHEVEDMYFDTLLKLLESLMELKIKGS